MDKRKRQTTYTNLDVAKKLNDTFFPHAIAIGGALLGRKVPDKLIVPIERLLTYKQRKVICK